MEKRGQFFVFGAIILCIAIFVLVTKVNTYEEKILLEDFPDLTENYKTESVKVVNDALLNDQEPIGALSGFTGDYVNYARTISPNIGFIYIYRDKETEQAYIMNYLFDENANIYAKDIPDTLFSDTTNTLNDITLNINGLEFKKTIPVKISNYDESYVGGAFTGPIFLEIGGIFYPVPLDTSFSYVAKDKGGNQIGVDVL